MNTQEQAYLDGFFKRASEYDFNDSETIELLKIASKLRETVLSGKISPENVGGITPELLKSFDSAANDAFSTSSNMAGAASGRVKDVISRLNRQDALKDAGKQIKEFLNSSTSKNPSSSYLSSKVSPERSIGLSQRGGTIWEKKERDRIEKELIGNAYNKRRAANDAMEYAVPGYFGTESSKISPEDLKGYAEAAGEKTEIKPMRNQYNSAAGKRDVVKPTGYWKGNMNHEPIHDYAPRSAAPQKNVTEKIKGLLSKKNIIEKLKSFLRKS